ncbi:MAG TPA: hypothetical protein VM889_02290 [Candidatus Thermoplasmatota archaeon]|nr:hypothetical protein [Candidatus Thermoplasmatota archaeon]
MRVTLPHRLPLVAALVLAAMIAGCVTGALDYKFDTTFEAGESHFEGREHQRNCILEAAGGSSKPPCAPEPTGKAYPAQGVRVLESFYVSYGAPGSLDNLDSLNYGTILALVSAGNWHRASNGILPDVIFPGAGHYYAALGYWRDVQADGIIHFSVDERDIPRIDNEWVPIGPRPLHGYVEPGSRPAATSAIAPDERTPDFTYSFARYYYVAGTSSGSEIEGRPFITGANNVFLFLDGSVLQALRVTTVSDAVLAPTPDGSRPYTPQAHSLIDVDRYVAMAPGPVEALYGGILWPFVAPLASPSYGSCPNGCELAPWFLENAPVDVGDLGIYGRYPSELEEGSGSTRVGLHAVHLEDYAPWIDLVPRQNPKGIEFGGFLGAPYLLDAPLHASSRGGLTMPPGHLVAEVWTGVWMDLDGDGWIGDADDADPYQGGTRPLPHDYRRPYGEFLGAFASGPKPASALYKASITVTATPLDPVTGWGPAGVWTSFFGAPYPISSGGNHCIESTEVVVTKLCTYQTHGPVTLTASAVGSTAGRYYSLGLFLPLGSPGFSVCTESVQVTYHRDGSPVTETLSDCDVIDPWP